MAAKVAVTAVVRNEQRYLPEWLAFHLVQGVQLFRIYDNRSDDLTGALLADLSRSLPIEYETWDEPYSDLGHRGRYGDAARALTGRADFVAFMDVDEFLFSADPGGLPAALAAIAPEVSAIAVNQRVFGSSGHVDAAPDLVTARFTRRADDDYTEHRWFKTIARPETLAEFTSTHSVRLKGGRYAMADGTPLRQPDPHPGVADRNAFGSLRLHHYITKSLEEYRDKQRRWRLGGMKEGAERKYDEGYFHGRQPNVSRVEDSSAAHWAEATRETVRALARHSYGDENVAQVMVQSYAFLDG